MRKSLIIVIVLILGGGFWVGGAYNTLVTSEESVKTAWSQVENVYQRRLDLVPNLVETVKGYAAHERKTLEDVIKARREATQTKITPEGLSSPDALAQFDKTQGALSSALGRLLVVVERYPDLKANQNFLALQTQLEGTENRIAIERHRFNEVAQGFNTKIRVFPTTLIARFGGFQAKAYFEAAEGAKTSPKVSFAPGET